MMTLGILLIAWGIVMVLPGLLQRYARWHSLQWSRMSHTCEWKVRAILRWEENTTTLMEECRRCPSVQIVTRPGTWVLNRHGDPVSATISTSDMDMLRRMWEHS